jgi:hypothetical protein
MSDQERIPPSQGTRREYSGSHPELRSWSRYPEPDPRNRCTIVLTGTFSPPLRCGRAC